MAKKRRSHRGINPEDIDENGCVEVGLGKVLVCGPELVPHVWDEHRMSVQDSVELSRDQFLKQELDRFESRLLPIVKPDADPVADAAAKATLTMPLHLDFGDGRRWYRYRFWSLIGPLLPEDPIESIDLDELAQSRRSQDAWTALYSIHQLRDDDSLTYAAIVLGRKLERLELDEYRNLVLDGLAAARGRRAGGQSSGETTKEEKALIVRVRDELALKETRPKIWAAEQVAAQLRTGTFAGISRPVDYSSKYIANLRAQR